MNSTISSFERIEDLGKVYYQESGHRVFYTMKKQISKSSLRIGDGISQYLDIYFSQIENDWETTPGQNTPKTKRYEIRACAPEDFPFVKDMEKMLR